MRDAEAGTPRVKAVGLIGAPSFRRGIEVHAPRQLRPKTRVLIVYAAFTPAAASSHVLTCARMATRASLTDCWSVSFAG